MSYWSLRRAAERSTAAADLAHGADRPEIGRSDVERQEVEWQQVEPQERPPVRLPDWTPTAHRVSAARRATVRQRALALEERLFTIADEPVRPDPLSADGLEPPRPRSRW